MRRTTSGALARTAAAVALLASPVAAGAQLIDFDFLRTSSVLPVFDNRGIFLQDPRISSGLALFPPESPNNYGFGSGLWVDALRTGVKIVSTAYDAAGGFSEFLPGRTATERGGADEILCSDDLDDLARWYPEFSDPARGEPAIVGLNADLDIGANVRDDRCSAIPDPSLADATHARSGLHVDPDRCFPRGAPCFLPEPRDPTLQELVRV